MKKKIISSIAAILSVIISSCVAFAEELPAGTGDNSSKTLFIIIGCIAVVIIILMIVFGAISKNKK